MPAYLQHPNDNLHSLFVAGQSSPLRRHGSQTCGSSLHCKHGDGAKCQFSLKPLAHSPVSEEKDKHVCPHWLTSSQGKENEKTKHPPKNYQGGTSLLCERAKPLSSWAILYSCSYFVIVIWMEEEHCCMLITLRLDVWLWVLLFLNLKGNTENQKQIFKVTFSYITFSVVFFLGGGWCLGFFLMERAL